MSILYLRSILLALHLYLLSSNRQTSLGKSLYSTSPRIPGLRMLLHGSTGLSLNCMNSDVSRRISELSMAPGGSWSGSATYCYHLFHHDIEITNHSVFAGGNDSTFSKSDLIASDSWSKLSPSNVLSIYLYLNRFCTHNRFKMNRTMALIYYHIPEDGDTLTDINAFAIPKH